MLLIRILFYVILLHLIDGQLHINLYLTNWTRQDEDNIDYHQHDCLYAIAPIETTGSPGQMISYCMSEWPSNWNIEENNFDQKFTFTQLSKQNITSQELYLWSAPMDIIESYQDYLNTLPDSENTTMAKQYFYNCTLPYFGPKCQYILLSGYKPYYSSLDKLVHDFYCKNAYEPTTFTCYTHLKCNRGLSPSCLDWSEICDGKVDCLDKDEHDEKHCWQLEIHECNQNEYRCFNGQCIPEEFLKDNDIMFDCLDRSDEPTLGNLREHISYDECPMPDPTLSYEDVSCIMIENQILTSVTSSCIPYRRLLLLKALFSVKPESISNECWTAFKCIIGMPILNDPLCIVLCSNEACDEIIESNCPDIIYATTVPILLGHVYMVYEKNQLQYGSYESFIPMYFCYNDQLLYLPDGNETRLIPDNNDTCRLYKTLKFFSNMDGYGGITFYIDFLTYELYMFTFWIHNDSIYCNKSTMYQCIDSYKCITKYRVLDMYPDCFHGDDEDKLIWISDKNCSIQRPIKYFKCQTTNECIHFRFVHDYTCDCTTYNNDVCDDEFYDSIVRETKILFSIICDNERELSPRTIDNKNYTDETECDQWPCNNIYTRCNGYWNCLNGADELNCNPSTLINCSSNDHICISIETKKIICLPIEKANDGYIDCIGAADEPILCRTKNRPTLFSTFYCKSDLSESCRYFQILCSNISQCTNKEDEEFCTNTEFQMYTQYIGICADNYESYGSVLANLFCRSFYPNDNWSPIRYFKLGEINQNQSKVIEIHTNNVNKRFSQSLINNEPIKYYQQRCHRGLDVQVWLNKEKNLTRNVCLCPPAYYGDICQFQNQRVSLTIQFDATSSSLQTPFSIIIALIDNSEIRLIHSYEQLTYLPKKHCRTKFHVYLLYSTRPKDQTKNYSIHIDIYEKKTLDYRGSFIKSLLFPFLPVHRLSFILNIPRINENINSCSDHQCIHGICKQYFDDINNKTFCQCHPGWSGQYCTIKYNCTCSLDSLCIGILANNRSLCVCPLNRMGDRCLLNNTIYQIDKDKKCLNNGTFVVINEYKTIDKQFICICPKGFTGTRCEIMQTKIIISFDKDIIIPSSILVHFINVNGQELINEVTSKMISFGHGTTTIYWSNSFHIAFIEWSKNYYLIVLQKTYEKSVIIHKKLHSSDRCLNISEIFNETILNYHLIRRIKYYHTPCQSTTTSHLLCFYDETQFCLCQNHYRNERVSNCFEFNHNMKSNCSGKSDCKNEGQCFQDSLKCPQTSICACLPCFYGSQCQLNTNGYSLSLDVILGYHIRPNIHIARQSPAVFISLILSILIGLSGIINGILTLITFKHKETRDVGCGIYLLCSSLNSLLVMIVFLLKVWILVFSHVGSIKNRSFLSIQCLSFDFILRFCLTIDQWLTTCVAIERAYITIKGINVNKNKIKLISKLIIIILILISIGTSIHDPIHRRLSDEINDDDEDEKRIWCIVSYSSSIHIFNLIISMFNIIIPFIINIISATIIIICKTRTRATAQKERKYKKILYEQIQQHKNLLIGPCVLIILAIPRLIIAFSSGCMKSTSNSWLFLFGYFISFIPSLLTFILFVLPSSVYYQVFRKCLTRYRNMLRMHS